MSDGAAARDSSGDSRGDNAGTAPVQDPAGERGVHPGAGASPGAAPSAGAVAKRAPNPWAFLRKVVVLFAIALALALLLKTFLIQPFYIPSSSMEDTLLIGDKVLVNKLIYHLRPIHRGDIVVFNGAGSWDPTARAPSSHNPLVEAYDVTLGALFRSFKGLFGTAPGQVDYIKRVIGLPGDHVACCDARGQITVNGVPLSEKPYLLPGSQPSIYPFRIVVPRGRLWVLGDNRPASADSRLHHCGYRDPSTMCAGYDRGGTIAADQVVGRAFLVVWPPNRFRVLRIPATFLQPGLRGGAARSPVGGTGRTITTGEDGVRPDVPLLLAAGGVAVVLPVARLRRRHRDRRRNGLHGRR